MRTTPPTRAKRLTGILLSLSFVIPFLEYRSLYRNPASNVPCGNSLAANHKPVTLHK
jgi:hypothetical protein